MNIIILVRTLNEIVLILKMYYNAAKTLNELLLVLKLHDIIY